MSQVRTFLGGSFKGVRDANFFRLFRSALTVYAMSFLIFVRSVMFSARIRLSAIITARLGVYGKRAFSIVPARQSDVKIYRSKRERPLIKEYKIQDKTIRLEYAVPEDKDMFIQFMSELTATQEPSSLSVGGVTADELRPFIAKIVEATQLKHTMVWMDGDRIIGGGVANVTSVNRTNPSEPKVRADYGDLIDEMESWLPSRNARRVIAPPYDLCNMVSHFLPKDVETIFRCEIICVHKSYTGGNFTRNICMELALMSLGHGLVYGDGQTTASATSKVLAGINCKRVFFLPYEKMLDHGERIHKKVPLIDGSHGITEFIFDFRNLVKNPNDERSFN